MPLVIHIQQGSTSLTAHTTNVRLSGSLDTSTAPELESPLATVLAGPVKELIFDLAQLTFISSAGLRVIAIGTEQSRSGQSGTNASRTVRFRNASGDFDVVSVDFTAMTDAQAVARTDKIGVAGRVGISIAPAPRVVPFQVRLGACLLDFSGQLFRKIIEPVANGCQ